MVKVKNINGTTEHDCSCGSWLKHWSKFAWQDVPGTCPEITCFNPPEVGAHVQKDDHEDRRWYIVPLCIEHNGKTGQALILKDTTLVPANVQGTCGR